MEKKLTEEDELKIYRLYIENGVPQSQLADIFGVSQPNISTTIAKSKDKYTMVLMQQEIEMLKSENNK